MEKQFVSNKDESVRLFKNDILESLSKVHFTVPLIIYIPVVAYFLYKAGYLINLSFTMIGLLFIAGIFVWTLAEYLIHRFVFHFHPTSEIGKRIHFLSHGVHHDYPNDSKRLVLVPGMSIPLAILFYYLFYIVLGERLTAPFYSGFVAGYLFYDTTHYALHHWNFKNNFWLNLKKHHMMHHYRDSENGFGVSSKFWDYLLRTMFKNNTLKVIIWMIMLCTPLLVNSETTSDPIKTGDKYFGLMRYKDAASWYLLSSNPESQWKLARAYVCYGDVTYDKECETYYRKAEKAARKCIELDEKNSNGHTYLAAALGNIAVYEGSKSKVHLCNEIKKELNRAIELNPNDDIAYSIYGSFYRILGNISWVERQLAKAFIGAIPKGGFEDSEKCLLKAVKLSPTTMRHWYELGLLYKDWGKEDKASQAFQKAKKTPVQIASDKTRVTKIDEFLKN